MELEVQLLGYCGINLVTDVPGIGEEKHPSAPGIVGESGPSGLQADMGVKGWVKNVRILEVLGGGWLLLWN